LPLSAWPGSLDVFSGQPRCRINSLLLADRGRLRPSLSLTFFGARFISEISPAVSRIYFSSKKSWFGSGLAAILEVCPALLGGDFPLRSLKYGCHCSPLGFKHVSVYSSLLPLLRRALFYSDFSCLRRSFPGPLFYAHIVSEGVERG